MASGAEAIGNPWATIWTRPHATIRRIVDTDVHYQVMFLAILSGAIVWLERRWSQPATNGAYPLIVVTAVVVGAIAGIVELYLNGVLLKWSGSALGGIGTYAEVRAAIAWSRVPVIVAMAIGIASILIGDDGPSSALGDEVASSGSGVAILQVFFAIWGFIVMLKCLGEVHRFSAWRALGSMFLLVLAGLLIGVVVVLFVGGASMLMHPAISI
jgi:hypothetical protein